MRDEPKIGSKSPLKSGGSGGGLSPASVGTAIAAKKPAKAAADPKRFMKVQTRRNADAMKKV